jgi:hypothetical protein
MREALLLNREKWDGIGGTGTMGYTIYEMMVER